MIVKCELDICDTAIRNVGVWTKLTITDGPMGSAGVVVYRRMSPGGPREIRRVPIRTNHKGNRTVRCKLVLDPPGTGPVNVTVVAEVEVAGKTCADRDTTRVVEPHS